MKREEVGWRCSKRGERGVLPAWIVRKTTQRKDHRSTLSCCIRSSYVVGRWLRLKATAALRGKNSGKCLSQHCAAMVVMNLFGLLLSASSVAAAVIGSELDLRSDSPSIDQCPGYCATNVRKSGNQTVAADLSLDGSPCNVYGTDLTTLKLQVEYQSSQWIIESFYRQFSLFLRRRKTSRQDLRCRRTGIPSTAIGSSTASKQWRQQQRFGLFHDRATILVLRFKEV